MNTGLADRKLNEWRDRARGLLTAGVEPERAIWGVDQGGLFHEPYSQQARKETALTVPRAFLSLARTVACHNEVQKWSFLYQALWRLSHGEPHLLHLLTDPLVHRLQRMAQAVRRDAHKAKAFVRFRHIAAEEEGDAYMAWHRSDHAILTLVAPFFQRRFEVMRWSILTPMESVSWDGNRLVHAEGVAEDPMTQGDDMERVWRAYYRATFNPARIKIAMMKREMPVRYWQTLPEAPLIPDMLIEAEGRVAAMLDMTMKGKR